MEILEGEGDEALEYDLSQEGRTPQAEVSG